MMRRIFFLYRRLISRGLSGDRNRAPEIIKNTGTLHWAKETNNLEPWQRGIAFSVGSLIKRGKTPSYKQAKQAQIIYDVAMEKGFIKG